jgi:hypothetical protein
MTVLGHGVIVHVMSVTCRTEDERKRLIYDVCGDEDTLLISANEKPISICLGVRVGLSAAIRPSNEALLYLLRAARCFEIAPRPRQHTELQASIVQKRAPWAVPHRSEVHTVCLRLVVLYAYSWLVRLRESQSK